LDIKFSAQDHPKFEEVAGQTPLLYSRELQMGEEKKAYPMSLREAVSRGIIANQTLGYFIGRTYLFLERIGAHIPQFLRHALITPPLSY
jgi:glycyl-tRNA synthetase